MTPVDITALKDIHTPIEPSAFPPAWGWIVLFWGALALLLFAILLIYKHFNNPKAYALKELEKAKHLDAPAFLKAVHTLLKRAFIHQAGAANIYGDTWVGELNQTKGVQFNKDFARLLSENLYASRSSLTDAQKKNIYDNTKKWIRSNL